jgi:hypothetical protein
LRTVMWEVYSCRGASERGGHPGDLRKATEAKGRLAGGEFENMTSS